MKKLLSKLFIAGKWQVYLKDNLIKKVVTPVKGFWYADPFLFEDKQKYLFVEAFNIKKEVGCIGYLSEKEEYNKLHLLISNNYHHSFPNVFKVDNQIYMIPESGEAHNISLYRFDSFPEKMSYVKKLVHGDFVDTALVSIKNNKGVFLTYEPKERKLYQLSIDFETLEASCVYLQDDINKQLRPAGNAFKYNDTLVLPFQNCEYKYGESIIVNRILVDNGLVRILDMIQIIDANSFSNEIKISRTHTLNHCGNNCSVIDFMVEGFSLTKPFKMLRRILRRKRHKDK